MSLIEIENILINPDHVTVVESAEEGSRIHLQNGMALTTSLSRYEVQTVVQGLDMIYAETVESVG